MADTVNKRSFNSFSGVDIKGVFNNQVIAELQAISYSITREKAPLYTMGAADPRSFSRGKRGIAGTLIFLVFDRHALIDTFGRVNGEAAPVYGFLSDTDETRPEARVGGAASTIQSLTAGEAELSADQGVETDQDVAAPWFSDQIPPFDITLAAANEYGALAVMRIFGVEILNEGYGVSIDDIVSEQQMSYIARTLVGWAPVALNDVKAGKLAESLQIGATG